MKSTLVKVSVASLAILLLGVGTAMANPPSGPISGSTSVSAYSRNIHRVVYMGGELADFSVNGDGDTTLNIIVTDDAGREIARTSGPGDHCHIQWRAARTSAFYITVVNEGGVYNTYNWRAY